MGGIEAKRLIWLNSKYQLMQSSSTQRRTSLELKIPELERTIRMVKQLRGDFEADQDRVATFELCDTLYATANISKQDNVYIWLGVGQPNTTVPSRPCIELS